MQTIGGWTGESCPMQEDWAWAELKRVTEEGHSK